MWFDTVIFMMLGGLLYSTLSNRFKVENIAISKSQYIFGIDISHYQGTINWNALADSHHPIKYIFIRSTMGKNGMIVILKRTGRKQ